MSWWTIAYRCTIIVLLSAIALQLGGWNALESAYDEARYRLKTHNKPPEEPAPLQQGQQSGLDAYHEEGTKRVLDDLARRSNAPKQ